jgi:hypothetical protein
MKYTLLSKWTVLLLTVLTVAMTIFGVKLAFGGNALSGVLVIVLGVLVYGVAWFVALFDSIQERKYLWSLGLIVLLPLFVGPAIYGLLGPKNTK